LPCFPKVHFNMVQYTSWSSKCPFLLGFQLEFHMYVS
jgi:hypothetical protein